MSSAAPHTLHCSDVLMCRYFLTDSVGIELCASLHANTLIFDGTLTLHKDRQELAIDTVAEVLAWLSNQSSCCFLV